MSLRCPAGRPARDTVRVFAREPLSRLLLLDPIFLCVAGRGLTRNGAAKVSCAADLTWAGNDPTQTTEANQPDLIHDGIVRRPAFEFAAADSEHLLASGVAPSTDAHSCFLAFRTGADVATTQRLVLRSRDATSGTPKLIDLHLNGANLFASNRDDAGNVSTASSTGDALSASTAYAAIEVWTGSKTQLYLDGALQTDGASITPGTTTTNAFALGCSLFGTATPVHPFGGRIGAVAVSNRPATAQDRAIWADFAKREFSIG